MKRMILFLLAAAMTATVSAQPLERVAPEEVGLNPKQLAEADSMIEAAAARYLRWYATASWRISRPSVTASGFPIRSK